MTDRNGQMRGAPSSPDHPNAKLTAEQLADIRRRHAEGERAAALAVEYGISRAGAFRVVGGYSYSPKQYTPHAEDRRRAAARAAEALRPVVPPPPPTSLVEQARAEVRSGKPLVVESLEARLQRLVPGAICFREDGQWVVVRLSALHRHDLARAASEREAVDVAVTLWGGR